MGKSEGAGLPRPGGRPLSRAVLLVVIGIGFGKRIVTGIAPFVPGTTQHRQRGVLEKPGVRLGPLASIEDRPPAVLGDPDPSAGLTKPYRVLSH